MRLIALSFCLASVASGQFLRARKLQQNAQQTSSVVVDPPTEASELTQQEAPRELVGKGWPKEWLPDGYVYPVEVQEEEEKGKGKHHHHHSEHDDAHQLLTLPESTAAPAAAESAVESEGDKKPRRLVGPGWPKEWLPDGYVYPVEVQEEEEKGKGKHHHHHHDGSHDHDDHDDDEGVHVITQQQLTVATTAAPAAVPQESTRAVEHEAEDVKKPRLLVGKGWPKEWLPDGYVPSVELHEEEEEGEKKGDKHKHHNDDEHRHHHHHHGHGEAPQAAGAPSAAVQVQPQAVPSSPPTVTAAPANDAPVAQETQAAAAVGGETKPRMLVGPGWPKEWLPDGYVYPAVHEEREKEKGDKKDKKDGVQEILP